MNNRVLTYQRLAQWTWEGLDLSLDDFLRLNWKLVSMVREMPRLLSMMDRSLNFIWGRNNGWKEGIINGNSLVMEGRTERMIEKSLNFIGERNNGWKE